MSAIPNPTLSPLNKRFIVRAESDKVIFTPINRTPNIRNFYLLETCEEYKFAKAVGRFQLSEVSGTLSMVREGTKQALEKFSALSLVLLLTEVEERVSTHYLRTGQ